MSDLKAFNDVKRVSVDTSPDLKGSAYLNQLSYLQIGSGSKGLKADAQGQWMGARDFASAPWSVDPAGNVIAGSITITGYIPDGFAAADINAFPTKITGTQITDNSITTNQITTGEFIALSAQIKDGIIVNAHIDSLEAGKITSQIINAQIADITWAKITSVAIVNADIVNLSADKINAGTLTGISVISTTGGASRIVLNSGDSLDFYASSVLKGSLRGGQNSGIIADVGSFVTYRDEGFFAAAQASGATTDFFKFYVTDTGGSTFSGIIEAPNSNKIFVTEADGTTIMSFSDSQIFANQQLEMNDNNINDVSVIQGDDGWVDLRSGNGNTETRHFDPESSGNYNLGGSSRYWDNLNVVGITKFESGSWGFFDEGVEMPDGRILADTEALLAMERNTEQQTAYGTDTYKWETLPRAMQVYPRDKDGNILSKDIEGNYYQMEMVIQRNEDGTVKKYKNGNAIYKSTKVIHAVGEDVFATISIIIGATKELALRVTPLETRMADLEARVLSLEPSRV